MKSMKAIVENQRAFFYTNATKSVDFRIENLKKLYKVIKDNEYFIYLALRADLNKSESEAYLTEVQIVLSEIKAAIKNVKAWSSPKKIKTPITLFPASSYIYNEPYGVTLILSPWNYPFQLCMAPLVGAIAGGNCAIIKTSKSSPATSKVIAKILNKNFPSNYIYSTENDFSYDEILTPKYDFIFFTGSENVGKTIMEVASKTLTPVSLELGGKSPCIVDASANIDIAAKRIAWGKYLNAGQTCVAPDYVLVDESVKEELIMSLQKYIKTLYENALENENYPKIINKHHYNRLCNLINNHKDKIGANVCEQSLKIEPTIFNNVTFEDEIMQNEIFGPILPIISYNNLDDLISTLRSKPKPLSLYLFSQDKTNTDKVLHSLEFGGGCVNDVLMHLVNDHLPFGGVGSSGMGAYHGKYSFDLFTHEKSIVKNKAKLDMPFRYPPYTDEKLKLIKKITRV